MYTSDHALGGDELYAHPVESTQALATLESVDASQALKVELSHDSTPCVVTQMLLSPSIPLQDLSCFALEKGGLCARSPIMLCPWEMWAVCSEYQPCFALGDSKHEVTAGSEAHVSGSDPPSHCIDHVWMNGAAICSGI